MTPKKVKETADTYLARLAKAVPDTTPIRIDKRDVPGIGFSRYEQGNNIRWAIEEAVWLANHGCAGRAQRLLAHVHGCLWMLGVATMNDGMWVSVAEESFFNAKPRPWANA